MTPLINTLDMITKGWVKHEILFLQALTSKRLFNQGISLFISKYKQFVTTRAFISEFVKRFINKNANWHESYDIFAPSTNNALERFNLLIKQSYTNWNRLDFNEFLPMTHKIFDDYAHKPPSLMKKLYSADEMTDRKYFIKKISESDIFTTI